MRGKVRIRNAEEWQMNGQEWRPIPRHLSTAPTTSYASLDTSGFTAPNCCGMSDSKNIIFYNTSVAHHVRCKPDRRRTA